MGHLGRYFEIKWADRPEVVITMNAAAMHLCDASTLAIAIEWAVSRGGITCKIIVKKLVYVKKNTKKN